jgi:D-psicose/D-tagatose/L-ribulose 3-epimerase
MKLGVHALVWVGGWSPDDARHAVASTAEAGYDLIEIPLLDPSSSGPTSSAACSTASSVAARPC